MKDKTIHVHVQTSSWNQSDSCKLLNTVNLPVWKILMMMMMMIANNNKQRAVCEAINNVKSELLKCVGNVSAVYSF